ncbi:hypothetical protein [Meiothermus granaticius]|uniref:hypothetical protein n=1 Tax=Meiothermus granaticius TaxID=863370 RepID=UPI001196A97A|nr:hypothetical protein [Meiothermus granaticius]GEM88102.1 hypothetical protein MGR01S_27270 [Meiothermus granaticius NBRC 107808]
MAARAQPSRALLVYVLVGLVLLVSSQYPLRDPRTQSLPVSFLPDVNLCTFHPGSSGSNPANPTPAHAHQPHCPLCIIGGFSEGPQPLVWLPTPSPRPVGFVKPQPGPKPHLTPVFPLLNRGPPQVA